jgi:copper(I)-binding protein
MNKLNIALAGPLFAGLFSTLAMAQNVKVGGIEIDHAYARAMVPGAKVGGGYLTLTNTGSADDKLVAIAADRAKSAEVHQMSVDGGLMKMRPVHGGLVVPAGQTIELKPGGYHVMFMGVVQPFKQGETVKATLTFEKAGAIGVEFSVGNIAGGAPDADATHSDMGGMTMPKPQ